MDIKFSVIIPLYNKENFIKKTVLSVLEQEYENFEIIVIDDCSKDKSLTVLLNQVILFDNNNKLRIYKNKVNKGVSYTRNKGIELSSGNYILFLDADDEINNKYLFNNLNSFIKKYKADYILLSRNYHNRFIRPNFRSIRKYLRYLEGDFYEIIDNNSVAIKGDFPFGGSGSAVISTNILKDHRFELSEPLYEDWLFFIDLFLKNKAFYYNFESIKVNFDKNSLTNSYKKSSLPRLPKVYYLLKNKEDYKQVKKEFFWLWLNSNIKKDLKYIDLCRILKEYKYEIKENITFSKKSINIILRITLKIILSFVRSYKEWKMNDSSMG